MEAEPNNAIVLSMQADFYENVLGDMDQVVVPYACAGTDSAVSCRVPGTDACVLRSVSGPDAFEPERATGTDAVVPGGGDVPAGGSASPYEPRYPRRVRGIPGTPHYQPTRALGDARY